MFRRITNTIFLVVLGLVACRRDDQVHTYRVPKETPGSMPLAMGMPADSPPEANSLPPGHPAIGGDMSGDAGDAMRPAATSKEISWKVPEGWQEQPPSTMRVGSFLIKEDKGQADMSVVPLSGDAGGDLANINRWRGQISLSPISDGDLSRQSETISPAGRQMLFVNFGNQGKRLMAAIYHRGERTWFFKMMGDDAAVTSAKSDFMRFLKSLHFESPEP